MSLMQIQQTNHELKIIYAVSQALLRHKNVNTLLNEVLDILDRGLGAQRATLTLLHENALIIEASKGLQPQEKARGRYYLGEGVTGMVAQKGEGLIIPDVSKEPRFLDRTKAREKTSHIAFICVPVRKDEKLIGTISIDMDNKDRVALENAAQLLQVIANLLADAVSQIRANAGEVEKLKSEKEKLQKQLGERYRPSAMIGNSSAMRKVYEQLHALAEVHTPLLIQGEPGTGKGMAAKAIHYAGIRQNAHFGSLSCAGMPEQLLEKELFGLEKDGELVKRGLLEECHGGTLFIDELTEMGLGNQSRLCDYLRTQTFRRCGGSQEVMTNVRIIASSSRDIKQALQAQALDETLYYHVQSATLFIPPLRERRPDIMMLADYFLEECNRSYGRKVNRISTPAINMIVSYHYPGNVTELRSCVERAYMATTDEVIHGYNLPPSLQVASQSGDDGGSELPGVTDLAQAVDTYERELIVEALKKFRGNAAAAARALNTTPRVLNYKFRKLNINLQDFKKRGLGKY